MCSQNCKKKWRLWWSDFYYDLKNYFYSKNISLAFNLENQNNNKIPEMDHVNSYATTLDEYASYYLFDLFLLEMTTKWKN